MDKVLKNIINKTIEREYQRFSDVGYVDCMKKNPEEAADKEEFEEKLSIIMNELYKVLPKEYHHLVEEFDCTANVISGIETRVAYKEGVILGATELSYLGEVGVGIHFI
jgi:hypothetical protein